MELVITEKPSVAMSIAEVIGATERKDGYLQGNGYIVSWCIGHLIELATPEAYDVAWKKWNYETLPMIPTNWQTEVKKDTKAQFNVLKKLMFSNEVTSITCATDAGREGELIFRLVVNQAGCHKPMKRLWISSMEEKAIKEGFENLKPSSEYDNLYRSALARQRADWLVGLNGTRLFTVLYGGKLLKVGRVQTPTLAMIVDRESEISHFKKEKYYQVQCAAEGIVAISERIDDQEKAQEIYGQIMGGTIHVKSIVDENKTMSPSKLYDLTTLQRDANRIFGFTARQTLEYTQSLYEKKLVTYPRTDSRYLSDDMEQTAMDVIDVTLKCIPFVNRLSSQPAVKRVMNSKKVSDHHAIIPTIELSNFDLSTLPETEKKVLFLIAESLLAATGEIHEYKLRKVTVECAGTEFHASSKCITRQGWKSYEQLFRGFFKLDDANNADNDKVDEPQDNLSEAALANLTEGMELFPAVGRVTEHFTKAPAHYTEDSLLAAMEKAGAEEMDDDVERKGLGTPATRADVIEKLVKDGYVKRVKKQMIPTDDGVKLITVLPEVVKSPQLTADWENALTLVAKGEMDMDVFMSGIEDMVRSLVNTYYAIGEEEKKLFGGKEKMLGNCPHCGADVSYGKYGAYCTAKCGMNVGRVMGAMLTEEQATTLLEGKKILVKGLKGKKGSYDAYLVPEGVEPNSYTNKSGEEIHGFQYKLKLEFPQSKNN